MWEYKVINTAANLLPYGKGETFAERLQGALDELGREGWELCEIANQLVIFKRRLEENTNWQDIAKDRHKRITQLERGLKEIALMPAARSFPGISRFIAELLKTEPT